MYIFYLPKLAKKPKPRFINNKNDIFCYLDSISKKEGTTKSTCQLNSPKTVSKKFRTKTGLINYKGFHGFTIVRNT